MAVKIDTLSDDDLLKQRICDLGLAILETELEQYIHELYKELAAHQLLFKPDCYLADEWLCPDQEPVIGIPFFLAHPRLKKLEMKLMYDVEGGSRDELMKLLRHECGHAVNYAYRFYKRPAWTAMFGRFAAPYPESYTHRPYSRKFVRHLENGYAQYHPDEDFAETFAVWLTPNSNWEQEYRGWPALRKLKFVDELMKGVAGRTPVHPRGKKYWEASKMTSSLARLYSRRRKFLADDLPGYYAPYLKRMFSDDPAHSGNESASRFLFRKRKDITNAVARWTGRHRYAINKLLEQLTATSRELTLHLRGDESAVLMEVIAFMVTCIMNYLYTGKFKPEIKGMHSA
jgi:hypothetical protein